MSRIITTITCLFVFTQLYSKDTLYAYIDPQTSKKPNTYQSRSQLLECIKSCFQEQYAPFYWKKTHMNWNWNSLVQEAHNKITSRTSTKQFHIILKNLLYSTKDPHVEIFFSSGNQYSLPIDIVCAENRLMVAYVKSEDSPIENKDEILSINGMDPYTIYKTFLTNLFGSESTIQHSYLNKHPRFTHRKDSMADPEPDNNEWQLILRKPSGKIYKHSLKWTKSQEYPHCAESPRLNSSPYLMPTYRRLLQEQSPINRLYSNSYKSFLPHIGTNTIEIEHTPSDHVYAYISSINNYKIGFIRICAFSDINFQKLENVIKQLQETTSMLIMDLTNNPGGFLEYGLKTLSLLSNKPISMPKFIIKIEYETYQEAQTNLKHIKNRHDVESVTSILPAFIWQNMTRQQIHQARKNLIDFYTHIIMRWQSGYDTTEQCYYMGIDRIIPNEISYSKPIFMVINECSSSCTELVASVLQDNKLAFSIGTITSGAGGFVKDCFASNIHGVHKWTLTSSILFRITGQPIESLGVTPDIAHDISWEDLVTDFQPFKKHIESICIKILTIGKIFIGVK